MLINFTTKKKRFMKRMSLVLVLAVLIMTYGLLAQQEKVTFAQTAAASQGNITIVDNVEVQKTTTTTVRPDREESRTTTTTEIK